MTLSFYGNPPKFIHKQKRPWHLLWSFLIFINLEGFQHWLLMEGMSNLLNLALITGFKILNNSFNILADT